MKTQLDLTLAAKDTAIKTMSAGSAFEANKIVSADFAHLKLTTYILKIFADGF